MRDLHIELVQGQNIALVDLSIRSMLEMYSQPLVVPSVGSRTTSAKTKRHSWIKSIKGLARDGRVISVRLALFAEMVKGKAWTPATLKEVGGTEGVGVSFLEETFNISRHRPHQQAARAVLEALLPEQGSDIKGDMQSHDKLLEASGYAKRPKEFEELLRILDS